VWDGSPLVTSSHTIHPLYFMSFLLHPRSLVCSRVVGNLGAQASRDSANSANYLPQHAQAVPGLDRKRNHASRGKFSSLPAPRKQRQLRGLKKILREKRKYRTAFQFEILLQPVNWGSRHSSFVPFSLDFRDMSSTVTRSYHTPVC